jgi:hypothetical protein
MRNRNDDRRRERRLKEMIRSEVFLTERLTSMRDELSALMRGLDRLAPRRRQNGLLGNVISLHSKRGPKP